MIDYLDTPDDVLVSLYARRLEPAVATIYMRAAARIVTGIVKRRFSRPDERADAEQEVFCDLLRALRTWDPKRRWHAYAKATASLYALTVFHRMRGDWGDNWKHRLPRHVSTETPLGHEGDGLTIGDCLEAPPNGAIDAIFTRAELHDVIASLPHALVLKERDLLVGVANDENGPDIARKRGVARKSVYFCMDRITEAAQWARATGARRPDQRGRTAKATRRAMEARV